ncbi:hypothetical protein RDABS01_036815 [Bienertia sinuspersici]
MQNGREFFKWLAVFNPFKQFDKMYNWIVLNPSIGKVSIDISISRSNRTLIKLCSGFGYDGLNDDYKYDWDKGSRKVKIYSMKAKSWRCVENKNHCDSEMSVRNLSTNGVLIHNNYCIGKNNGTTDVAVPNLDMGSNYVADLWVFDGCLCFPVNKCFDKFDGWIMKEYGVPESWTKFCFDVPYYFYSRPLYISVRGTIEEILLAKLTSITSVNETKELEITGPPEHLVSKSLCLRSLVNDFGDCQTTKCNAT